MTDDGEIELSFHIDSSSDIDTFALERRTGYSGPYQQIELFTGGDTESLSYTDRSARTDEINFTGFLQLFAGICPYLKYRAKPEALVDQHGQRNHP